MASQGARKSLFFPESERGGVVDIQRPAAVQLAIKSTRERQMAEVGERHARDAFFGGVLEQRAQNRLVLRAVDARQHRKKFRLTEIRRKVKLRE